MFPQCFPSDKRSQLHCALAILAVAKSKNARPEAIVKIPDDHLGKRSVLKDPIPHIDAPSKI